MSGTTLLDPRKLSDLSILLKLNHLSPKRTLSQNFLIDKNILEKIVHTAGVKEGEKVLEIGPGPGALTLTLLEAKCNLLAIELDDKFASLLPSTIKGKSLEVVCCDFLEFTPRPTDIRKVIANIPYHISTPIIERLALYRSAYSEIYLTVEKDFAKRILSKPGTRENNAMSLITSFFFDAVSCFNIPASCFYPRPKIDSTLIRLIPKKNLPIDNPQVFVDFIWDLFQKRRKMIRSILGFDNIYGDKRPENLNLEECLDLFLIKNKNHK